MPRRALLFLVAICTAVLVSANPASAHNTLLSSDPADGSTLIEAQAQVTLVFGNPVPLDTLSIELIDASGVRSTLSGSIHGASSDTEVVTPLPALPAGEVTMRWRLVGPDGHPITGRVSFTITAPVATTQPATATTVSAGVPATAPAPTTTVEAAAEVSDGASEVAFEEPWSTPSAMRWLFRLLSYLAIMTLGGVIATGAFVWERAWSHAGLKRVAQYALVAAAALAIAQLLVIASDIRGAPLWSAFDGIGAALETDAGVALAVRIVLIVGLAWIMFMMRAHDEWTRWIAAGGCTILLLATWAYAGHSRSMRWSLIGVPLDVAHHAAAAAWIGGLAIVGIVAIRDTESDEMVDIVQRFARLAPVSVAVIVGTGAVQALRLVGSPTQLLAADHGRYLLFKLVVMGVMLKVADINRQRVNRRFTNTASVTPLVVHNLRRAMGTELAVGLGVIAVTAAMVVSPPAIAQETITVPSTTTAPSTDAVSTSTTTLEATTTIVDPAVGGAADSAPCSIAAPLSEGSSGGDVMCLQQTLVANLFLDAVPSGTFDGATGEAVMEFQVDRGLVADGVVGPVTAASLGIWGAS